MEQKKAAKAYIIGVGPGSPEWLTAAAERAIKKSNIILGWEWSLHPIKPLTKGKKVYFQDAKNYLQVERESAHAVRQSGETVAILRVGDPCVSSSLTQLLEVFHDCEIEIVPSVGSVQLATAAAQICLDEAVVITFHDGRKELRGEKLSFLLDAFNRGKHLIILTDETQMPHQTARYLIDKGLGKATPVFVGEHLSLKDERIFRGSLGQVKDMQFRYTSVMVVKHPLKQ